jgi:hypothetical protein
MTEKPHRWHVKDIQLVRCQEHPGCWVLEMQGTMSGGEGEPHPLSIHLDAEETAEFLRLLEPLNPAERN